MGAKITLVTMEDIINACNHDYFCHNKENTLFNQSRDDSHALSHKTFGQFIHTLLTACPSWYQGGFATQLQEEEVREVLNTKFAGDSLYPLSLSYRSAQEEIMHTMDGTILCPDFIEKENSYGTYLGNCCELQFLTFLAQFSRLRKDNSVKLICRCHEGQVLEGTDKCHATDESSLWK